MNSACAEPRLRCRVKDLVTSCFNTCRLPLEEEEPGISGSKPAPKTSVASDEDSSKKTPLRSSSHNSGGGRAAEAEPRFAEEDYIVFCFGEDGEIHMINNDRKSSEFIQPCSISTKMKNSEVEVQPNASKMDSSFESCDSSVSDSSTTSFAFPVLGMEWIGSPLHMPNAEKRDGDVCRRCCRF